ncbi:MAG: hypothetical protein ACTHN5_06895 [Phycisphaerae bacterium]
MESNSKTVDLPLTLHVSFETREKLAQRAAAAGSDIDAYVSAIVEQTTHAFPPLAELSGPVHQRFLNAGTSDDQLADELEQAKHARRAERRARNT